MMDRPLIISEKRGITITLGVLIHFVVTIALVTGAYVSIRQDLTAATDQGRRNEIQLQATQALLDRTRMDVNGIGAKFDMFLQNYDRDMNKYVRSDKDRR